ncbi:unnamed protein product [Rhizophagus irregularis]|nr:unnamed protein product [Rhizophagus irregularis]CAB5357150.1 unnamed protein product [Rhizophagus irregularis]
MLLQKNTFTEIEISYLLDQFFLKKNYADGVFLPENIRESAKSESRGESVANRSKVEKNWRILDEAIVISYSVFRLLRIGFNKNLELPLL